MNNELTSGIIITAISKYSGIFLSIIIGAVLARLLTPEEFGTVAIVTVFISFFNILADIGIGPAIIQNRDLNLEDHKIIYGFTLVLAIILSLAFIVFSKALVIFYEDKVYFKIGVLLSISIFFYASNIVPLSLLRKEKRFKLIGLITVASTMVSGFSAIVLVYNAFSYYSIVAQAILNAFLLYLGCVYFVKLLPSFRLKIEPLRKIARFSTFQFLFNFINYFSRNLDSILIGKYLGQAQLGFYDKSYRLMMLPIQNLTHVITPVLHPILSEYQDERQKIFDAYMRIIKILASIGFPLSVFLFFSASEIIILIFGNQWWESIPVFQILALSIGIQILLSSTGAIFQSINRTDLLFWSGALSASFMAMAVIVGIFIGGSITSVSKALLVAFSINFFQGYYMLIKIGFQKSYLHFLLLIVQLIVPSLILFGIYNLLMWVSNFYGYHINTYIFLVIKIVVLLPFVFTKSIRYEFKNALRKK